MSGWIVFIGGSDAAPETRRVAGSVLMRKPFGAPGLVDVMDGFRRSQVVATLGM